MQPDGTALTLGGANLFGQSGTLFYEYTNTSGIQFVNAANTANIAKLDNSGNWTANTFTGPLIGNVTGTASGNLVLSSLSATTPLSYNNSTGAFSIQQGSGTQPGYISSTDWTTFNNKFTSPLTTNGDLLYYNSTNTRLPIGTTNQVLTVIGGLPVWQTPAASGLTSFSDPTGSLSTTTTTGSVVASINLANPNVFTATQAVNKAGIGTTATDGLVVGNTTAAAAGAQQVSPNIVWQGNGWATTPAASQLVRFRAYVLPMQSAATPGGTWYLQSQINNGTWINDLSVDNGGNISTIANISAGRVNVPYVNNAGNSTFSIGSLSSWSVAGSLVTVGASNSTGSNTSGIYSTMSLIPYINQASGTGGTTDLLINRTETALGSGLQSFIDLQVAGTSKFRIANTGTVTLQAPIITKGYTVGTLPTGTTGMRAYVTDASSPVMLATVAGGGSTTVGVFYNGTNWIVE